MARLEELKRGAVVKGILPDAFVTVVDVKWIGSVAIELTYKDSQGKLGNELIYRDREVDLEILESGKPWSFNGEPDLFRLVSEAHRIRLAYLFDPLLAVHTSLVDPTADAQARGNLTMLCYIRHPFTIEPDFGVTSANYKLEDLLSRGGPPQ